MKLHLPLSLFAYVLLSLSVPAFASSTDADGVRTYSNTGNLGMALTGLPADNTTIVFSLTAPSTGNDRNYFANESTPYEGSVVIGGTDENGNYIEGTGLHINDSYGNVVTFAGTVTGCGGISRTGNLGGTVRLRFTGDVTGYTGAIELKNTDTDYFYVEFGGDTDSTDAGTLLTTVQNTAYEENGQGVSGTGDITFSTSLNYLTYKYDKNTLGTDDTSDDITKAYVTNKILEEGEGAAHVIIAGTADIEFTEQVSITTLQLKNRAQNTASVTLREGVVDNITGSAKALYKAGETNLQIGNLNNNTLNVNEGTITGTLTSGTAVFAGGGIGAAGLTVGASGLVNGELSSGALTFDGGGIGTDGLTVSAGASIAGTLASGTATLDGGGFSSLTVGTGAALSFLQTNSEASSTLNLNDGAVLNLNTAEALSGVSMTAASGSTIKLNATNALNSNLSIGEGVVVELGAADALGTAASLTFNGGMLRYGEGLTNITDISAKLAHWGNGNTVTVDVNGNSVTWADAFSQSYMEVQDNSESGTGMLLLTSASKSGPLRMTLRSGTLVLQSANSLKVDGTKIVTDFTLTGGTLRITGDSTGSSWGLYGSAVSKWNLLFDSTLTFSPESGKNILVEIEDGKSRAIGFSKNAANGAALAYDGSKGGGTVTFTGLINAIADTDGTNPTRKFEIGDSANTSVEVDIAGGIGEASNTDGQHGEILKTGDGALRISSSNYMPKLTVQEGTVIAAHADALGKTRAVTQTVTVGTADTSAEGKAVLEMAASGSTAILQGNEKGVITSSAAGVKLTVGEGATAATASTYTSSYAGSIKGTLELQVKAHSSLLFSGSNTATGKTVVEHDSTLSLGEALHISGMNGASAELSGVSYGALAAEGASLYSASESIWHISGNAQAESATLSQAALTVLTNGVLLSDLTLSNSSVSLGTGTNLALENVTLDAASYLDNTAGGTATMYGRNNTLILSATDMAAAAYALDAEMADIPTMTVARLNGMEMANDAALTLDVSQLEGLDLAGGVDILLEGVTYGSGSTVTLSGYEGPVRVLVGENGTHVLTGSAAVPEPATATLSLLALTALAARRRRR